MEPVDRRPTPRQWARANLFSTPFNAALTVVIGVIAAWATFRLARWVFVTADWAVVRVNLRLFMVGRFPVDQLWRLWVAGYIVVAAIGLGVGAVAAAMRRPAGGAETAVATDTLTPAAIGTEAAAAIGTLTPPTIGTEAVGAGGPVGGAEDGPDGRPPSPTRRAGAALHRFWPAVLAVVVILGFTRTLPPTVGTVGLVAVGVGAGALGARLPAGPRRWVGVVVVAGLVASLQVVIAGESGVGWDDWGGLHLAVSATVAGIALAFPLGLLLALGRRSSLPAIRALTVGYIEAFRAVPLVTLLFLGRYMIGFLFPNTIEPPSFLVRAVIAITVFEAAYIAEIVRGGLQAVPRGQVEAAQAIGLSPVKVMRLVVLPQALRAVIPAMVGQFISLFKDTSLLAIVGFFEMLRVVDAVTQQDAFRGQGLRPVALAFVGLVYWAGCSTMSRESRRLERRLGVGER